MGGEKRLRELHGFQHEESSEADSFNAKKSALAGKFAQEHYDEIYRYCARRLPSKEDAQDATQEVFLRLVHSDALYSERGKPLAYLYTCARNVCSDFYRSQKPVSASIDDHAGDIPDPHQDRVEQHLIMDDALASLTEEEREVLELRYGQDLSVSDIAVITGKSRFALYRTERRALSALKHLLGGGQD